MTAPVRIVTGPAGAPHFAGPDGAPLPAREGLRRAREVLGVTARELGPLLGVSGRTVEGWEQGRYAPPGSALLLLRGLLEARAPRRKAR